MARAELPLPLPSITIEADVWNATWISYKAFELVDRTKHSLKTEVKAGESIDITFIFMAAGAAGATGFAGHMGQMFAKDLYQYIKKRIAKVTSKQQEKPHTSQKLRIVRHSREWDEIIEEYDEGKGDRKGKVHKHNLGDEGF